MRRRPSPKLVSGKVLESLWNKGFWVGERRCSMVGLGHEPPGALAGVDPIYMSVAEKKTAMVESARLRARAEALDLQLSAAAEIEIAEETGSRLHRGVAGRSDPRSTRHRPPPGGPGQGPRDRPAVHGRTATSIVVTIVHTTLLTVLGSNSEILDLGRTSRPRGLSSA
jgi:hypothetical protein